jgi:hypothetical protein
LKLADLHIHTQASDGWLAPSVAVEQAKRAGLTAISIADHDSVAGIEAAIEAGKKYGIEVIPGVELSSGFEGRELHILGYFIDWRDKWLQDKLLTIQEARVDRAKRILEKLRGLNINISYNVTIVIAGGAVGRGCEAVVGQDLEIKSFATFTGPIGPQNSSSKISCHVKQLR